MESADIKPDNYYQNVREEMLGFIPRDAARILEVGCGEGHFGGRLKEGTKREVWGVEVLAAAARAAEQRLDRVLSGDIAELVDDLPARYFDAVVFNDVLEHLVDPDDVLARMKRHVSEQGVVISSIPNIRFFPTFYELLVHRTWEYEESGILDRTHLRFFTVESIRAMYERLGYEVLRHEGINELDRLPKRFHLANTIFGGRLSDMRYTQFATVARPRSGEPGTGG
jgi:2-polyprenyl-3-methyl-5-hydroxy-6-metoxy-1,4-benzoquinol methylase